MGRSINYLCNNCGNSQSYSMGRGMLDYSIEAFFNGENKRDYNRIIKMINNLEKNKEKYNVYYSNNTYLCNSCGYTISKKSVIIRTKYWKYEYTYSCPKCESNLNIIDIEKEVEQGNIICSKCQSNDLSRELDIRWD